MTTFIATHSSKITEQCWEHWLQIVQQFVWERRQVTPAIEDSFQAARRELLEACATAETAAHTSHEERAAAHQIEECVSPWMSLDSLRAAPPDILRDVQETIQQVQRQVNGQFRGGGWKTGAVFLSVFVVIFIGMLVWLMNGEWLSADMVTQHFARLSQTISDTFAAQRSTIRTAVIVVCLGLLTFIGAYVVMRSPRIG
jgi:hypothetical protein